MAAATISNFVLILCSSIMLVSPWLLSVQCRASDQQSQASEQQSRASEVQSATIKSEPPKIERKEFQAWNPFNSGPKIPQGQKALTQYAFNMRARFDKIEVVDQEERHGRWFVHIRPQNSIVRLFLTITIWTPQFAPKKCREHEEGHRIICERVYGYAQDIVRYFTEETEKKTYYGEGATAELAQQDAYKRAAAEINQRYREIVFQYAQAVSDEYDRITAHGLNDIGVDAAIEEAFNKCGSEMIAQFEAKQVSKDQGDRPPTKSDSSAQTEKGTGSSSPAPAVQGKELPSQTLESPAHEKKPPSQSKEPLAKP